MKTKPVEKVASRKVIGRNKKKSYEAVTLVTPAGRFSYPNLAKPNPKDEKNQYSTDLLIPKAAMMSKEGKAFVKAINDACQEAIGCDYDECKHPVIVDMDEVRGADENVLGHYRIRAKDKNRPKVYDAATEPMDVEDIEQIKGGDYGRICVSTWKYDNEFGQGFGLNLKWAQFQQEGEAFGGGGNTESLKLLGSMEVTMADVEEDAEDDEDENFDE